MAKFTDGNWWLATEEDCKAPWGGAKNGKNFRCALCGYKFIVGDLVRWIYGAGHAWCNFFTCYKCDEGNEADILKLKKMDEEVQTKYWWFVR